VVQWQSRARRFVPVALRRGAAAFAGRLRPVGVRGRNYVLGAAGEAHGIAHVNVYFDRWTRRRLLREDAGSPADRRIGRSGGPSTYSLLRRATEADFTTTMCDGYLVKVDRASMLNSLEIRAPFLDVNLIEFAFGRVPDHLRATARDRKILPRLLGAKLLPPRMDLTRKQGFLDSAGGLADGIVGAVLSRRCSRRRPVALQSAHDPVRFSRASERARQRRAPLQPHDVRAVAARVPRGSSRRRARGHAR
jgi:hypothetical protein